ncbi:uncharacterized protein [Rutidosis leptorrhynchoides]|uniref:uncharacterized protein n=1 Tax=Rutidosis leptorrhynchoides TaxID=125765 RepID=UPI003A99EA67
MGDRVGRTRDLLLRQKHSKRENISRLLNRNNFRYADCTYLEGHTTLTPELWELYTDGASGPKGPGAGLLLTGPNKEEHTYALRFNFKATNNEAKYEALLAGVRLAKEIGVKKLQVYVDSYQIPRSQNKQEDVLNKLVALTFNHLEKKVLVEQVFKKSIEPNQLAAVVEEAEHCSMTNIIEFLKTGSLPEDDKEAKKDKSQSSVYKLRDDVLYRKSYLGPSFHCVGPKQAEKIIDEVHARACALHSGFRTVVEKIKRLGYYWSGMYNDAAKRIRVCQECQLHTPISKASRHPMIPITSPCSFYKWTIDVVGPFHVGSGSADYLVVAIDFFTKWVAKQNHNWCQGLNIKQSFTSIAHPQANEQCKVTDRDIVHAIKARLGKQHRGWVNQLPKVLWAHRMILKNSTGETPFSLVYGSKAFFPAEVAIPTERMLSFNQNQMSSLAPVRQNPVWRQASFIN